MITLLALLHFLTILSFFGLAQSTSTSNSHPSTAMTTPSLEDWVTSHLGAFFPTSTAPKEDMEDGQDWFANAFNRAFAPDVSLTLATIEPPEDDPDKKLIAQKLAETIPGQGDEVKQVSGTEAVDALRELAAGAPRVEFQDVKKAKCENDQVRSMDILINLTSH
jgi:hypothetical protein